MESTKPQIITPIKMSSMSIAVRAKRQAQDLR
jgi:hypothetical protein